MNSEASCGYFCEHVEAERSGERSALNAEPADVLCGRLLNAESEEVPGGEGLEIFDLLHCLEAKKSPRRWPRARKSRTPKVFSNGVLSSKKRKNLRDDVASKAKNDKADDVPKIRGDFYPR